MLHPKLQDKNTRMVAGHRGMMAFYPENTLLSFEKALEAGVHMLETDIRLTRDLVPVLIHDASVDRTTNGQGLVNEMSLEALLSLDAGVKMGSWFEGQKVPTLTQFCQLMKGHPSILLNIEIKDRNRQCVDLTVKTLKDEGLLPLCVFTCFDADILEYIYTAHRLPTQGFPSAIMRNYKPGYTESCMTAVGIPMDLLNRDLVNDYEDLGILPFAYCPDDEESAQHARNCGVLLVTCNNPYPALKVFSVD